MTSSLIIVHIATANPRWFLVLALLSNYYIYTSVLIIPRHLVKKASFSMEAVLTAILGEIANRSISFLIVKWLKQKLPTNEDQMIHNLQQLLRRVNVIIEEAEVRKITNQAMVHQLNMLRKEMYRGYFTMDNIRRKADEEYKTTDHDVSHPFALSKFNPAKGLFFSTGVTHGDKELQQVLYNLN